MSAIETLLQVMRELRDPDSGCPWDIRQTSASIAPYTLDETHELLDAIERNDTENLKEELGDLLFNIVSTPASPRNRGNSISTRLPRALPTRCAGDTRTYSANRTSVPVAKPT